jgi:hypothetical protein
LWECPGYGYEHDCCSIMLVIEIFNFANGYKNPTWHNLYCSPSTYLIWPNAWRLLFYFGIFIIYGETGQSVMLSVVVANKPWYLDISVGCLKYCPSTFFDFLIWEKYKYFVKLKIDLLGFCDSKYTYVILVNWCVWFHSHVRLFILLFKCIFLYLMISILVNVINHIKVHYKTVQKYSI